MPGIRIKRGTAAQLIAAASANQLAQGEPYLITDQGRIAVGTSANTYETYAKQSEVGGAVGGASGNVQYNAAGSFAGMSGTTWDDTNRTLTVNGATVTTSQPILNLSQTWNAGGVAFRAFVVNTTDTASAVNSNLASFQTGGTERAIVSKRGNFVSYATSSATDCSFGFASTGNQATNGLSAGNGFADLCATGVVAMRTTDTRGVEIPLARLYGWANIGVSLPDTALGRSAAGVVEVNNGTTGQFRDLRLRNLIASGLTATNAAAPTIASASTISPTTDTVFVSGTVPIDFITPPSPISAGGGKVTLIPTGLWPTTTAGNIAIPTTTEIGRALIMTWDVFAGKWYPSYTNKRAPQITVGTTAPSSPALNDLWVDTN